MRGRLSKAVIDRTDGGTAIHEEATFRYGDTGLRAGRRVVRTENGLPAFDENRDYLLDELSPSGWGQVLEETVVGQSTPAASFVYGLGPVLEATAAGERWLLGDQLGSTRLVLAAGGTVAGWADYDAFGELLPGIIAPAGVLFTGERYDPVLGEYFLRARLYDPTTGRFTKMDTFPGVANLPQSLHKYSYVHSNPVNGTDPSGHFEGLAGLMANMASRSQMVARFVRGYQKTVAPLIRRLIGAIIIFNLSFNMLDWHLQPYVAMATRYNGKLARMAVKSRKFATDLLGLVAIAKIMAAGTSSALVAKNGMSVEIKTNGFPDFTPWRINTANAKARFGAETKDGWKRKQLFFQLTGNRTKRLMDFDKANKDTKRIFKNNAQRGPGPGGKNGGYNNNWTWHHHEVIGLMQLVASDVHSPGTHGGIDYVGGASLWAAATVIDYSISWKKPFRKI